MRPVTLLVIQLLPLVVFMVVDSVVTDVRISIACAIGFAVAQLGVTWARHRRFDWLVLLDVALIGGMGGISIALDDPVFFLVKPAILEGLTVLLLIALLAAPAPYVLRYMARLAPGGTLRPDAVSTMKPLLGVMCGSVALHVAAVLYAAFHATRATWALVSGPGFYVALLPALVAALVMRRRRARPT